MKEKINMSNFEANKEFLKKTNLLNKEQKILEIGSGKGSMVNYLKGEGYKIIGTELSQEYIKEAYQIYGKLPIKQMSGDNLQFKDNSFYIVLSFDVFEHIPDSDKHLQEVRRVLKPRGYYLLQTPNKITNMLWEIICSKSLRGNRDHVSLHTYYGLKKRFKKNHFKIEFVKIPITNEFTLEKVKKKLGAFGLFLFNIFNPDKMPWSFKTNYYIISRSLK